MKTPVLESIFNKTAGIEAQAFSCEFCKKFKSIYFLKNVRTTAYIHMCGTQTK